MVTVNLLLHFRSCRSRGNCKPVMATSGLFFINPLFAQNDLHQRTV